MDIKEKLSEFKGEELQFKGMLSMFNGLPFRAVNDVLEFASVFILIPNHATE